MMGPGPPAGKPRTDSESASRRGRHSGRRKEPWIQGAARRARRAQRRSRRDGEASFPTGILRAGARRRRRTGHRCAMLRRPWRGPHAPRNRMACALRRARAPQRPHPTQHPCLAVTRPCSHAGSGASDRERRACGEEGREAWASARTVVRSPIAVRGRGSRPRPQARPGAHCFVSRFSSWRSLGWSSESTPCAAWSMLACSSSAALCASSLSWSSATWRARSTRVASFSSIVH